MQSSETIYNKYLLKYCINDIQLDVLKNTSLKVLFFLHEVCVNNEIEYSIAYGTMLGAIRHQGFIPWDDDLDIIMTRDNYNKFKHIISKNFSEEYWVRDNMTDKTCPFYFGKLLLKNSVLVECQTEAIPAAQGFYVDIFILDNVPKSKTQQKIKKSIFVFCSRLASLTCDYKYPSKTIIEEGKTCKELKTYYKKRRMMGFFASILPTHVWAMIARKVITYNKKTEYYWTGINLIKIPVSDMDNLQLYPFEKYCFYGIHNYDSYLKSQYGKNYMQLPPEEKRIRHMIVKMDVKENE